jgi:hypothetical protein
MAGLFDINAVHDALGIKPGMPVSPAGMGVAVLPVWISVYLLTLMLKQCEGLDRHGPQETDRKTWQGFSPYVWACLFGEHHNHKIIRLKSRLLRQIN